MLKIITFIQSAIRELKHKVAWPTQEELQRMVIVFLIGNLICTLLVASINIFFQKMIHLIYNKF